MADELTGFIDKLQTLPEDMQAKLNNTFASIGTEIVQRASSIHKYTSRTGRLTSSIKAKYTNTGVEAYLDTGVAPYAPYVHAEDPFLTNAFESMQPQIDEAINRAIDEVLQKV